jgi:hypothetical protein
MKVLGNQHLKTANILHSGHIAFHSGKQGKESPRFCIASGKGGGGWDPDTKQYRAAHKKKQQPGAPILATVPIWSIASLQLLRPVRKGACLTTRKLCRGRSVAVDHVWCPLLKNTIVAIIGKTPYWFHFGTMLVVFVCFLNTLRTCVPHRFLIS